MRLRELQNNRPEDSESAVPQANQQLKARRDESDAFYAAAQQAIGRVLSVNSETFLSSIEQTGGQ